MQAEKQPARKPNIHRQRCYEAAELFEKRAITLRQLCAAVCDEKHQAENNGDSANKQESDQDATGL